MVIYYIFDLSDHYGTYTLEHTKTFHSVTGKKKDITAAIVWQHLADIPFSVWVLLGCIPYLQFFWILLLCTKSQPRAHFRASIIPFVGWLYICNIKCEKRIHSNTTEDMKVYEQRREKENCRTNGLS